MGETKATLHNTGKFEERGLKLPKAMKDILDNLVLYNFGDHRDLATFGVQYTDLTMTLLAANRPSAYITRINCVVCK